MCKGFGKEINRNGFVVSYRLLLRLDACVVLRGACYLFIVVPQFGVVSLLIRIAQ